MLKVLLVVTIINSPGVKQTLKIETTSDVCHIAGELISRDLMFHVQEVSYECNE